MFNIFKKRSAKKTVNLKEVLSRGALIVDVRSGKEYDTGHPAKSINIPLRYLGQNIEQLKAYDKPIITCCVSGRRSGLATKILSAKGLEVYNGGPWQSVEELSR